jgi:DNA (cytosine-5)-methyltransferase 1
MSLVDHSSKRSYRLENTRGPRIVLPTHPEACDWSDLSSYVRERSPKPTVVDLFCGAGGLSLGLMRAGFRPCLGVDRDPFAVCTHAAHFPGVSIRKDISDEEVLEEVLEPLRD